MRLTTREEVIAAWPEAIWMPWDDPPVNATVLQRADGNGRRRPVKVIARYHAGPARRPHDCPSCRCDPLPQSQICLDYWVVEWLDVWGAPKTAVEAGDAFRYAPPGSEDAAPIQSLEYPPSLGRV